MIKKAIVNALLAFGYIVIIASVMFFGPKEGGSTDSIFAPIAIISLFTLSTAVMGFLFGYAPFQLYFNGKKKEAVNLFLQTILVFGLITFIALGLLFFRVFNFQ